MEGSTNSLRLILIVVKIRLMLKPVLISIVVLALTSRTQAEIVSLSVHDLVSEVSIGSLQIQKAKSSFQESVWKKKEAYSGFLPTLTGSVNYLTDKKYLLVDVDFSGNDVTIPQIIPTTVYTLQGVWPVFDGFASTHRYLSESLAEDSAKSNLEWTQFSTTRIAILQFYQALGAQILKEVADQNFKTLSDHLKDIQAYKKAGVSTQYDVLRVEVQVSEAQSEILNSEDNYELSLLRLREFIGQETEALKPVGQLPILNESLVKGLNKSAYETRKDLLAMKQKMQAAQSMESALNRYWVPKINLVGQFQKYNNRNDRFDDESAFREAYSVGVNLTWNLFDGMVSVSRGGAAEQQAIQADKSYRMAKIKAQNDFEFWRRKFLYYCTVYRSRVSDVAKSTESVRLAQVGRRAGTRTNAELLDAETDLYRSKAGQVRAQIGAVEALVNLELSSGQKLYDFN